MGTRLNAILFVAGYLVTALGVLTLAVTVFSLITGDPEWPSFLESTLLSLFLGPLLILSFRGLDTRISIVDAYLLTLVSWLLISFFSTLPLYFSSLSISFTDALFESVAGITTTGSTVLTGLDSMNRSILLWRSLLQWFGGAGIIVMAVAILPYVGSAGMSLLRVEYSDRSEKFLSRAVDISQSIILIYVILTVICAFAYHEAGMPVFDAVNHAMTTLATGGFSTHDNSMAHFQNPAIEWTAIIFMFIGGLPLILIYQALRGRIFQLFQDSQVRSYSLMFLGFCMAILVLKGNLREPDLNEFRSVMFSTISIFTTTGYASTDYMLWGAWAPMMFLAMTYFGACTGSTSGGLKVMRYELLYKITATRLRRLIEPRGVFPVFYNGRSVSDDIVVSVTTFFCLYIVSTLALTLVISLEGLDIVTSLSAAATAIGNVGPGIGEIIGPAGNFKSLSDLSKWALAFGMILGRLEIYAALIPFMPLFWRR